MKEGDHLVFRLDSIDLWCHVRLFMVQGKYNIDASMDLKIEKNMILKDFKNLLQKLALQMWNRCVTVFKDQRLQAFAKKQQSIKFDIA